MNRKPLRLRSAQGLAMASVVGLAVLAGLVWTVSGTAQESPGDTRITTATGEVDVKFKGDADWTPAEADTPLETGDAVRTGAGSSAEISFGGQSIYELQENSNMTMAEMSASKTTFDLSLGTLLLHIRKLAAGQGVEVKTKAALAAVVGTELAVSAFEDGVTSIACFDGEITVDGQGMPGVPGRQFKIGKEKEMRLKFGVRPDEAKPLKEFEAFKPRLKAMNARRIQLRRDWQAMPPEKRAELRQTFAANRQKRMDARAERFKKEGRPVAPGGKKAELKQGKADKPARPAKGGAKKRRGGARRKK